MGKAPVTSKKSTNPVDHHIGLRIRSRRLALDKSQEWLGDQLGLTFQQVQKYEKGTNRVGGSRMAQIASALQTDFVGDARALGPEVAERDQLLSLDRVQPHLGDRHALAAPLPCTRHSFCCR